MGWFEEQFEADDIDALLDKAAEEETGETIGPAAFDEVTVEEADAETDAGPAVETDDPAALDDASVDDVPVFAPDDEVEPGFDEGETVRGQEPATEPAVPNHGDAETEGPAAEGLWARLQHHTPTQLGVALVGGALVFTVLQLGGSGPAPTTSVDTPPGGRRFPSIPVDGLEEPLSADDVRRLLDRAGEAEAPPPPPPAPPSPPAQPPAPIRLEPGQLYDESGQVGVVVGTPEDRARVLAREAARDRRRAQVQAAPSEPEPRGWGPEFYEPGGTLEVKDTAPKSGGPRLDLEVGTLFEASLIVGVSSLAPEVVVARVVGDVRIGGRLVVHEGATLRGRAQPQQDRLFLRFTTLEQRGTRYRLDAYAADKRMPGVVAVVREASLEARGKAGAGRSAVGTAGGVVGEIVGQSLPGRLARSVAEGVANEAQQDLQPDRSRVLELPVGRRFQVIVAGSPS